MKLGLEGAKVVVAGSSKGTGLAIAKAFAEEGAKLWLTGRDAATLKTAAASVGGAETTACDLETNAGRRQLAADVTAKWGALDALVLNIGSGTSSHRGIETPDEEWQRMFNLNFFTHAALIRLMRDSLAKSKQAAIVSVSSICGEQRLGPIAYGAAKAALNHFCVSSAAELAQAGIRFNAVAPGHILTPGGIWEKRMNEDPTKTTKMLDDTVPLRRFAKPEEIAAFVAFLASPRASYATGSIVRVDGGTTIGL